VATKMSLELFASSLSLFIFSLALTVFNEEYNFSFHVPKKYQCGFCISYHQAKDEGNLTPVLKEEYEKHQERKV
jgi:hypothetical protein